MREHGGGAIVNITSISALRASTLRVAYGTSKAGTCTSDQAVRLSSSRCSASASMRWRRVRWKPRWPRPCIRRRSAPTITTHIPLNRYGLEDELAEAIFFLCSDRSSYITGQMLAVDGGFDATGIGLPTLRREGING